MISIQIILLLPLQENLPAVEFDITICEEYGTIIDMMNTRTYRIITFGCQMNEHDSEVISGMLSQRGYIEHMGEGDPDIIIINTCSIRENADKRFFGTLGQLKKIKLRNPDFTVCVCGCMMQQEHITTKLRQSYPFVDVIFGTHNIHEFPDMLEQLFENRHNSQQRTEAPSEPKQQGQIRSSKDTRVEKIYEDRTEMPEGLPARRMFAHKSFVNIMFGCNNFCTYCIVPYTRGREKSRAPENIIEEVKQLVSDGVKEVTLLGQNVNSYRGIGFDAAEWDFSDLIWGLSEIDGLERIRFMTSHPKDLSDKLIDAFARCDKLCNYIHLPVQSGSSTVLKRMNRKYDRERYMELVRKIREAAPGIAISTDIIVGFPGETEEEFEETLSLAKEVQYDSAFTFLYSPRKGTPAAEYEDQIPETVKHERFNRLVEVMNEGSKEKNAAFVGRTCRVLVDGPAKKQEDTEDDVILLNGRTEEFKLVDFQGTRDMIGQLINVKITGSNTFSLRGEVVND